MLGRHARLEIAAAAGLLLAGGANPSHVAEHKRLRARESFRINAESPEQFRQFVGRMRSLADNVSRSAGVTLSSRAMLANSPLSRSHSSRISRRWSSQLPNLSIILLTMEDDVLMARSWLAGANMVACSQLVIAMDQMGMEGVLSHF